MLDKSNFSNLGLLSLDGESGFTLIEFIVAVAIVGIAIVPLMGANYFSRQSNKEANKQAKAVMVGRWKLERVRAKKGYDTVSEEDWGNCLNDLSTELKEDFDCQVRVNPGPESPPPNTKQVELRVRFNSSFGGQRTIKCRSMDSCSTPDFVTYFFDRSLN